MAKKTRIINEDPSINFRLSEELKNKISELAQTENKTTSNYLRDHLESFVDGTLFEKELNLDRKREFIFSEEFMQLIVWMYSKRSNKECIEEVFELEDYINTLKKVNHEFPYGIRIDFEKVLLDVLRVKNDRSMIKKFTFTKKLNEELGFDFKRFENYILKGEGEKSFIKV